MKDSCLTVKQVSERLGVSEKTVRREISDTELEAVKVRGRIVVRESDLAAYISSREFERE
jgi:excisionase family DNA binding protein